MTEGKERASGKIKESAVTSSSSHNEAEETTVNYPPILEDTSETRILT